MTDSTVIPVRAGSDIAKAAAAIRERVFNKPPEPGKPGQPAASAEANRDSKPAQEEGSGEDDGSTKSIPAKPEAHKALAEREARAESREKALAELEVKLKAEQANLVGRREELDRQKQRLAAFADYSARMQDAVTKGVNRAHKTLEVAEQIAAPWRTGSGKAEAKAALELRQQLERERQELIAAKAELEGKYRDAIARISRLEKDANEAVVMLEKERKAAGAHVP